MFTRLWCAGILCPFPELKRFHLTCFYCRWRRAYLGKWTIPPYWIDYTIPWNLVTWIALNEKGEAVGHHLQWRTLKIDPRGHFTMLRCSAIVTLDKIMLHFRRSKKPLMEFCEFLANYPTW